MPSGTYTYTMYTISGSGNNNFTVTGSFTVTVFDSDDNFGVGDDQLAGNGTSETGAAPVIQSLGAGAPPGWNIGDTFYFGGSRGIESGSPTDDFLIPKVNGGWQTTTALYSLPDASVPLVVGNSYTRSGAAGNVDSEVAPCFTAGTLIKTKRGEVPVEDLGIGDHVLTLDGGYQPLRWIGSRKIRVTKKTAPIQFDAGALGNDRDLLVSPNHRMLIRTPGAELFFGDPEILVQAKDLTDMLGVRRVHPEFVVYVHILFDAHQLVYSNGAASESFYPGTAAMSALEQETRDEVIDLFPELADLGGEYGSTIRTCLRSFEVPLIQSALH